MHRPWSTRLAAMLTAAIIIWIAHPAAAGAESGGTLSDAEIHELLEKSLSIVEIDKEIERISSLRSEKADEIRALTEEITAIEAELDLRRDRAGAVLRAWYTGERDALLRAVISFDSLADLFAMLDYVDVILSHDKFTLDAYVKQRELWVKERDRLVEEEHRLAEIEHNLRRQRERVIRLQAEVDRTVAASGDEDRLRLLIAEWIAYWEDTGLPEVERYFRALADAMADLPDWLAERSDLIRQSGFTYTVRLPEDELNGFLRSRDDRFRRFAFRFDDGLVTAHGRREDIEVEISGRYVIENEPEHVVRFHVERLVFNGFALPDTTARELERKFDLGFYPQLLVPFVRATDVAADDGVLAVELRIDLGKQSRKNADS